MKRQHPLRARIALLVLGLGTVLMLSACSVTPHANLGLDVNYYNGGFHVRPEAHVGVTGRPN